MSIKKEAYLCLSAMLRAREPRLLNNDRAQRMLEAASFEDCAKQLGDCGYADMSQMSAKEIESELAAHREALRLCHREDLIGFGHEALVPPERDGDRKGFAKKESLSKGRIPNTPQRGQQNGKGGAGKGKTPAGKPQAAKNKPERTGYDKKNTKVPKNVVDKRRRNG